MDHKNTEIPAIRLLRDRNGESYFESGKIRTDFKIKSQDFWFATEIDLWQIGSHNAPQKQFVITLSGKLKFTTGDGLNFIVEPGIILLAEDIDGKGHQWEMIEGHETWHRMYMPLIDDSETFFIKDKSPE